MIGQSRLVTDAPDETARRDESDQFEYFNSTALLTLCTAYLSAFSQRCGEHSDERVNRTVRGGRHP